MKKIGFLLSMVLFFFSCERRQTPFQNSMDTFYDEPINEYIISDNMDSYNIEENYENVIVNENIDIQGIIENIRKRNNISVDTFDYNILIGSWVSEWYLPISAYENISNINSISDIDIRTVNLINYHGGTSVRFLSQDGRFSAGPLSGGAHVVVGAWHHEDLELVLNFTPWELGEEVSMKFDILLIEDSGILVRINQDIEKWRKIDINGINIMHMIEMFGIYNSDEQAIIENIGININTILSFGRTPLMFVIRNNRYGRFPNLPRILIENGADIHIIDSFGRNAAHYLIEIYQHHQLNALLEILTLLKNRGINLDIRDVHGKTPFDYVRSEIVRTDILRKLE